MKRFAFLSRHQPTTIQHELAALADVELVPVGDMDAFTVTLDDVRQLPGTFAGVVVVHPAAAMRLCSHYVIGVFENASRAAEGEKPVFTPVALHLYDRR